jgi:hypothetical protein
MSKATMTGRAVGGRTVLEGDERVYVVFHGDVRVEVDLLGILRHYGHRAVLSKGRKSRLLLGLVTLTASNVTREQ